MASNSMYNEEFTPKKGDRVLYQDKKYRILNCSNEIAALVKIDIANGLALGVDWYEYQSVKVSDISFLYECPWLLFWQRL